MNIILLLGERLQRWRFLGMKRYFEQVHWRINAFDKNFCIMVRYLCIIFYFSISTKARTNFQYHVCFCETPQNMIKFSSKLSSWNFFFTIEIFFICEEEELTSHTIRRKIENLLTKDQVYIDIPGKRKCVRKFGNNIFVM